MSDYLQHDEYLAALEEATRLIGMKPDPASSEDERLDQLLHRIATFPPAFSPCADAGLDADAAALLMRLRADIEILVRKRAERSAVRPFLVREHGVGPTL
jgi:hypothetical protein